MPKHDVRVSILHVERLGYMARHLGRLFVAVFVCALVACSSIASPHSGIPPSADSGRAFSMNPFHHVVIVVQENRTPDNLFHGLPNADTLPPSPVKLKRINLAFGFDPSHTHKAFLRNLGGHWLPHSLSYVDPSQVTPYFDMAAKYGFADRMFQSNEGPSFPAHIYLIAGTSLTYSGSDWWVADNPVGGPGIGNAQGGCDAIPTSTVWLINEKGDQEEAYPCIDRLTLMDLVANHGLSWRYYQDGNATGLWHAPDAIRHLWSAPDYNEHVITSPAQFLADVRDGQLANVSWITPSIAESDHPGSNSGAGPGWVRSVVNAVGESPYWNDTVIFVVWDDWGGFYDHVKPPINDAYELGFRVPMLVISAYTPKGYVSHIQHEFGSILKFTESTFELGSLGTTDTQSDDLSDFFNFTEQRSFDPIH